jgi:hypothetical protein
MNSDRPYVYRDEPEPVSSHDPEGRDIVIVDGRAMSYRRYRGRRPVTG